MKNLKNVLALFVFLFCMTLQAQNKEIAAAFSSSYESEIAKKYETAIAALNTVYDTTSYEMNLRLGWLNYLAGKTKESIAYYQKAAANMPAATEPKWAIITVYTKLENWTEIEKTYISILKLDAKNATANYNLGLIYYYRKNYIEAKKFFDVSLNQTPFGYNYLLMSAWTNYFLGNKSNASILFNKVLLYAPNDASALEGLGLIK
jgi:tetratricopeptide (TPR) repeat protein